jgi:Rad3-related DNA helicase
MCGGVAMTSLKNEGVKNIIITSGTLSPLDSFAYELKLYFLKLKIFI